MPSCRLDAHKSFPRSVAQACTAPETSRNCGRAQRSDQQRMDEMNDVTLEVERMHAFNIVAWSSLSGHASAAGEHGHAADISAKRSIGYVPTVVPNESHATARSQQPD